MASLRPSSLPLAVALALAALALSGVAAGAAGHCPADGIDALLEACEVRFPELELPDPPTTCPEHEASLRSLDIGGNKYSWEQYADWGAQLFDRGWVQGPPAQPLDPTDPSRSRQISDFADYTCARCHNSEREDPVLTDQDPVARLDYIRARLGGHTPRSSPLKMTQGVTLWGGVNRSRFYNGLFSFFNAMCVPATATLYRDQTEYKPFDCSPVAAACANGCRLMSPASLADGIQLCGRFCGVGRFLEDWEMASLLTYHWDRQVVLADVLDSLENRRRQLDTEPGRHGGELATIVWRLDVFGAWHRALESGHEPPYEPDACVALGDSILAATGDTRRDTSPLPDAVQRQAGRAQPITTSGAGRGLGETPAATGSHPALLRHARIDSQADAVAARPRRQDLETTPGPPQELDAEERQGRDLYELSCARCHGPSPAGEPQIGGRGDRLLAGSAAVFHTLVADGLTPTEQIPPNPIDPSQEALYMPEFTLERLGTEQAALILEYLQSLPPTADLIQEAPSEPEQEEGPEPD